MGRLAFLLPLLTAGLAAELEAPPTGKWAAEMKRFDEQDAERPPQPGGIVFVGSSSIRLWDLAESFPDSKPLNRGFGGSQLADSVAELDRLVLRHKPRTVVLYAGDNDLANGKSVEQVVKDFEAFVAGVRRALPETKVVYIAVKPSPKRWPIADKAQAANRKIREVCDRERAGFVDVWPAMLGADGLPRKDLFVADDLHLNDDGYEIWTALVGPHLE